MKLPLKGDFGNIVDDTGAIIGETRQVDDADMLSRIVNQASDYYYALGGAVFLVGSLATRNLQDDRLTPEEREGFQTMLDFMGHLRDYLCGVENNGQYLRALAIMNRDEFHVTALWNFKDLVDENEA